ncbi:(2Fe-2S)-binding protein [Natranaerobius thermophilus]|uniref:(2Fe-2S)-binding domain protein n=1 Tax=Natranaerobius thermophilus (strain ATCC BAA-1301 / DSM 18059 / JW/NM-WN-LF) TaxID=457570 RepID=B2A7K9_NATTJ|nr:(2Fe-2S)-binding protein [Natranaerobius thermophilus]ACB85718.1 (2Fe-2S)-binding domain protein [Natranaerobius thermophilus JW/NM-WN-LF]
MNKTVKISFELNGKQVDVETKPNKRLLDLLRDDFNLTGVKEGCGEGECGVCTVIMDGEIVNSCMVLAPQAEGSKITTIEGVSNGENELDVIQEAFIEQGAVQCGFCIPGMILSTKTLLDKNDTPSEEEIKTSISGNLCRCTGYTKIVDGVKQAAKYRREGKGNG